MSIMNASHGTPDASIPDISGKNGHTSWVTLVTGAAAGIGKAITMRLLNQGHRVIAMDRDQAALDALAGHSGIIPVAFDLSDLAGTPPLLQLHLLQLFRPVFWPLHPSSTVSPHSSTHRLFSVRQPTAHWRCAQYSSMVWPRVHAMHSAVKPLQQPWVSSLGGTPGRIEGPSPPPLSLPPLPHCFACMPWVLHSRLLGG
mgnify:CR=1 FL=1